MDDQTQIRSLLEAVAEELKGIRRNHRLDRDHPLSQCQGRVEELMRTETVEAQDLMSLTEQIESASDDPRVPDLKRDVKLATGSLTTFVLSRFPQLGDTGLNWQ